MAKLTKILFNKNWKQTVVWIITALAGVYSLNQIINLAWVCDDAFISFRYAQNLIEGHGLVFNIGETVEGYTNFLWTMLISVGMILKIDPVLFSQIFSILSFTATIGIFIYLSKVINYQNDRKLSFYIPVTSLALMFLYDFQVYATSGLETSFVTTLVSAGFAVLIIGKSSKAFLCAGICLVLAALTRPDSLLFYFMALPYIFLLGKNRVENMVYYLIPLLIVYLPYWLWRYNYYGYPFPNTYYAISASLSYFSQGFVYLWLFVKTYYIYFLLPIAVLISVPAFFKRFVKSKSVTHKPDKILLLSLFFILPYLVYVVRTGGDFMFARFFIVIIPISLFMIENSVQSITKNKVVHIILAIVIVAGVHFRYNQFVPHNKMISGVIDERAYYPPETLELAKLNGANLKKYLTGKDVRVGFYGSKAMTIYYSELPVAIECHTGLTDEYIAHLEITERGRPGHEKMAPHDYLYDRKVNFIIKHTASLPQDQIRIISFDGSIGHIMCYDKVLMDELRKIPEVKFADYEAILDKFIAQIDTYSDEDILKMYKLSKNYYFDHNDDPGRHQAFIEQLMK